MSVKVRVGRMLAYGTLAGLLVWGIADVGIRIASSGRLYDKTTIEQCIFKREMGTIQIDLGK